MDLELTDPQIERYARHLVLPEVGEEGQARLLGSRVLVVGAGGLGSPLLLYLAAAGVGTLGVVDDDQVDLSNLQRQIVHDTSNVRLVPGNALELIGQYDLVADGSDNFPTRYLVNDACYLARKTLVAAAIMRFDGQLSTYKAHEDSAQPCYRCIFGAQPGDPKQSCADVGVLGALAGTLGALQATEVIKELLGIGESLAGRLLLYDSLGTSFHTVKLKADPACPLCGPQASIRDLETASYRESEPYCAA